MHQLTLFVGFTWLLIGIIYGAILSKGYKKIPTAFTLAKSNTIINKSV
jgi:hypothetical protein